MRARPGPVPAWVPDALLGPRFETATLPLDPMDPDLVITLVRPVERPEQPRAVLLHVHGYNDYFFQDHLAAAVGAAGMVLYAVDLRRSGRSLRAGQVPHLVADLREHAVDLSLAVAAVRAVQPDAPLVVHAHSTGALATVLWAHGLTRPGTVLRDPGATPDALVLDGPFLALRGSSFERFVSAGAGRALGRLAPLAVLRSSPSHYAWRLHEEHGGRWRFDEGLKRPGGLPARAAWLRAVVAGQDRVARGLEISVPVLVARSARSGPDRLTNPVADSEDTVLDVASMARVGRRLGPDVTELVVDGAVHDLTLSARVARETYLRAMLAWVARVVADDDAGARGGGPADDTDGVRAAG